MVKLNFGVVVVVIVLEMAAFAPVVHSDVIGGCSRTCYCSTGAAFKYGKACGLGYTNCDGEVPCDSVDAACFWHDACVTEHGMLACYCAVGVVQRLSCALDDLRNVSSQATHCRYAVAAAHFMIEDILFLQSLCFSAHRN
jgi:secretory phospholipase A2